MECYKSQRFSFILYYVLHVIYFINLGLHAQILEQKKDNVTATNLNNPTKNHNTTTDTVIAKTKTHYTAAEMCHKYSELIYINIKDPVLTFKPSGQYIKFKDCITVKALIVGGSKAELKEFPHMALLGYNETINDDYWACGGSLISEKWILTAAHCEKIDDQLYARWARLGTLNYISVNIDSVKDYRIIERKIHPDYHKPSLYNDIALFQLEKNVDFSPYIRPICLNTNHILQTSATIASGWGTIRYDGPPSPDLLKVELGIIPINQCNASYASYYGKSKLRNGIVKDSMICAGFLDGGRDTCRGDSGGPIQINHSNYTCMLTQIGITSFGRNCATNGSPGVYTKVSAFIPWIEQIVWPIMS